MRFISNQVTKLASSEIGTVLNFKRSSIKFFPPGIKVEEVEAKIENIDSGIEAVHALIDEIDLNFNLTNLFKNKISFKNSTLSGGYIFLKLRDGNKGDKDRGETVSRATEVISWRKKLSEKIHNIILKDIRVDFSEDSFYIKNSSIIFKPDIILLKADLHAASLPSYLGQLSSHPKFILDRIYVDLGIGNNMFLVNDLRAILGDNSISFNGGVKGDLFRLKSLDYSGNIYIESRDQNFIQNIFMDKGDHFNMDGHIKSNFKIWGRGGGFQTKGDIDFFDFKAGSLIFNYGKIKFEKVKNDLIINSIIIDDGKGKLNIKKPFAIFNFSKKTMMSFDVDGEFENIALENIISLFQNSNYKLKSSVSGFFNLRKDNNVVGFSSKKLFFKNLNYATKKTRIVNYRNVVMENVGIVFNSSLKKTTIIADLDLLLNKTSFSISGYIGKETKIKAIFDKIYLNKLIDLNGLNFSGMGTGSIDFKLSDNSTLFDIDLDTKESGFNGYGLGDLDIGMLLSLDREILIIEKAKLTRGDSRYFVAGDVSFKNNVHINLDGKVIRSSYLQLKNLIHPITKDVKFLPDDLLGVIRGGFKINGPVDDLNISGRISAQEIGFLGEVMDSLDSDFLYKRGNMKFENIILKKGRGSVRGRYAFSGKNKNHYYDITADNMRLHDFSSINQNQFSFDADMYISAKGNIRGSNIDNKISIDFKNSTIAKKDIPDSSVNILIKGGVFHVDASIFGNDISLASEIFWRDKQRNSNIDIDIKTEKIRELLGIISSHNVYNLNISGEVDMDIKSKFSLSRLEDFDMSIKFNKLDYNDGDTYLEINEFARNILIQKGRVKSSNIMLQGKQTELSVKVSRSLDGSILFLIDGNLNASMAKIFHKNIIKSNGTIFLYANLNFLGDIGDTKIGLLVKGQGLNVTYSGVPAPFEDVDIGLIFQGNRFIINKFSGNFSGGRFDIDGSVLFRIPFPVFDLRYNFENSEIKILEKTKFWISSRGTVSGSEIPYIIAGDVYITSGEVFDSLKNFKISKKKRSFDSYIPQAKKKNRFNFFKIKSRLAILESVHVKNDLLEMYIHGSINIHGDFSSPGITGNLILLPDTGKIYFKTSNFILKNGDVTFGDRGASQPYINLVGESKIHDYMIKLEGSGHPDDFNLKLTSDPELSEREILSLLVTGVTSKSKDYLTGSGESEAVFWGVGMFIFDRFRINQELNSSLGLNLSIDSAVIENQDDYGGDHESPIAKRSTKILVSKKITDSISAEMSSTLSGDISTEKSLGVNYNINKNVSLEGVYEIKGDHQDEQGSSDSIGGDVKFRFEF